MLQISIGNSDVGAQGRGGRGPVQCTTNTSGFGPRCREGVTLLTVALPMTRHHENRINLDVPDQPGPSFITAATGANASKTAMAAAVSVTTVLLLMPLQLL